MNWSNFWAARCAESENLWLVTPLVAQMAEWRSVHFIFQVLHPPPAAACALSQIERAAAQATFDH
jgi:hypothetical protein